MYLPYYVKRTHISPNLQFRVEKVQIQKLPKLFLIVGQTGLCFPLHLVCHFIIIPNVTCHAMDVAALSCVCLFSLVRLMRDDSTAPSLTAA